MADDTIEQRVRSLEVIVATRGERLETVAALQHQLLTDVRDIRTKIDSATGGWKLALLIGLPSLIGSVFTGVIAYALRLPAAH